MRYSKSSNTFFTSTIKNLLVMALATLAVGCGEKDSDGANTHESESVDLKSDGGNAEKSNSKELDADKTITETMGVNYNKLERIDGIFHLKGSHLPYTGKSFDLHKNGAKQKILVYKDGKPEGLQRYWHDNGHKSLELNLKSGENHGLLTVWNENGNKNSEANWKDGRLNGLQLGWHENGQKRIRIRHEGGRPEGLWTAWDENGSKVYESRYKLDDKVFCWHENGKKAYQATYEKDTLVETSWYENGQQSSEKNYKNFQRDGTWTEWNETGEIESEEQWKGGRQWDGKWTLMLGSGENEKRCEIVLKDGSGTRIYYRKNGTVFHRTAFEAGRVVKTMFPPSTTPLDAQDFEGDVAKVLETMSEEDRKKIAVLPQEMRTGLLKELKDSIFLKRIPKNFEAAEKFTIASIPRIRSRMRSAMESELQHHEDNHRSRLLGESARKNGEFHRIRDSFGSFISGEIFEGRTLSVARKAKKDAQKRHLEEMTAKADDLRKDMVDGRDKIRRAKESGDTNLSLHGREVTDLTPLAELTQLTELGIYETKVTDISPLAKLTKLTTLKIRHTILNDITPLASLTDLRELELINNGNLTDFQLVARLAKLTKLHIAANSIEDLSFLKGLSNLERLDLEGNKITDLTPLKPLRKLANLSLANNMIVDLTPLTELTNLIELDLRANHRRSNPIPLDQRAMLRKALPNCRILFGRR